jgi:hypothetical protein
MADAVTSQKLVDGAEHCVYVLTNLSDGTGESAVLKVDVSALNGAPSEVKIASVNYSCWGMSVSLLWDATTDVRALVLQGDGTLDFGHIGGLPNNSGTGKTGDLLLTTTGHTSGDTYTIVLELEKVYG